MSRWSRPVTGLAMTVLVTPLLMACGGGGDPAPEGTPTPKFSEATSSAASPDVSESASSSESADAKPKTPEQVARAMVRGVGDALNTGDPDEFLKYSTDKCDNCLVVADNVEQAYLDGGSAETEGWRVKSLRVDQRNENVVYMAGSIASGKECYFRADGTLYKRGKASTIKYQFRVAKIGGAWRVTGWNLPQ